MKWQKMFQTYGEKVYAGSQKGILSNVSKETNKLMARKLFKLIIEYKPDLIISTHPFSSQMVSYLKKKRTFRLRVSHYINRLFHAYTMVNW